MADDSHVLTSTPVDYDAQLRASHARQLRANPLFNEILQGAIDGYMAVWGGSDPGATAAREECYQAVNALKRLRQEFDNVIDESIDQEPT